MDGKSNGPMLSCACKDGFHSVLDYHEIEPGRFLCGWCRTTFNAIGCDVKMYRGTTLYDEFGQAIEETRGEASVDAGVETLWGVF